MSNDVIEGVQAIPEGGEVNFGLEAPRVQDTLPQSNKAVEEETVVPKVAEDTKGTLKPLVKAEKVEEPVVEATSDEIINELLGDILDNTEGEITEEHLEKLKKTGLSKGMLETLVKAKEVERVENDNAVFELVGGQEVYEEMAKHAVEHYSDAQLDAYNTAVFSGNRELARLAILGLKADYTATLNTTTPPKARISGGNTPPNADGFTSQQEVVLAMSNRKYGRDINYTKEVDAKRAKTAW